MYALIGLCLVLLGICGLQFTYMFYVDRVFHERKKYMHELEHTCAGLRAELAAAEERLATQHGLLEGYYSDHGEDETWADVIGER